MHMLKGKIGRKSSSLPYDSARLGLPALLTLMAHQPDLTLEAIRSALTERHGITVGQGTVSRFLAAHNITLKKSLHAAEPQRREVAAARRAFIRRQPALDPERLVFIDDPKGSAAKPRRPPT
jgi:hypothetical protein